MRSERYLLASVDQRPSFRKRWVYGNSFIPGNLRVNRCSILSACLCCNVGSMPKYNILDADVQETYVTVAEYLWAVMSRFVVLGSRISSLRPGEDEATAVGYWLHPDGLLRRERWRRQRALWKRQTRLWRFAGAFVSCCCVHLSYTFVVVWSVVWRGLESLNLTSLQEPSCDVCKTYVTVLLELKGQYSHCQCTQIWKLNFKEFSGNDADGPQYWAETTTIVPGPAPFTVKPWNSSWCVNVRNWRNDTTINDAVVAVAVIALESVCSSKRCSGDSSNGCRNSSIAYSVLNARCNRCSNRQRRLPRVFTASQCCRRSPVINVS